MKYLVSVFAFCHVLIFSSVNEPLSINLSTGYREDNFSFRILSDSLENNLIYREKYKHDRFFTNKISLKNIYRDFYFSTYFTGSYLFKKTMNIKDSFQGDIYSFDYRAKGYDLETALEIGYAVNLTPLRYYKCILIPILGYSGFWKSRKREDAEPNPLTQNLSLSKEEVYSSLNLKKLNQKWYGTYLGFLLEIKPNTNVNFTLGYNFNFLRMKLQVKSFLEKNIYDLSDLLLENQIEIKDLSDMIKSCYAHRATMGGEYIIFPKQLSLGLFFDYKYFISDKGKGNLKVYYEGEMEDTLQSKAKVFSRWWYFSTMINLLYRF